MTKVAPAAGGFENEIAMSKNEALYQSVASCGAVLIAFIGVIHEFAGHVLFPWGPDFLGDPVGWHAAGLFCIAAGVALLGGTLRIIYFPVIPLALFMAAGGAFFVGVAAVLHGQFHMFALVGFFAGIATAYFHRKAEEERGSVESRARG